EYVDAPSALRAVCCEEVTPQTTLPRSPEEIGDTIFPSLPPTERPDAVEGLLAGLCIARNARDSALLPIRGHLFFRNLQGLWVCPNLQCTDAPARTGLCPVGRLHYAPTLTCSCGARVLELLYCEAWGRSSSVVTAVAAKVILNGI